MSDQEGREYDSLLDASFKKYSKPFDVEIEKEDVTVHIKGKVDIVFSGEEQDIEAIELNFMEAWTTETGLDVGKERLTMIHEDFMDGLFKSDIIDAINCW